MGRKASAEGAPIQGNVSAAMGLLGRGQLLTRAASPQRTTISGWPFVGASVSGLQSMVARSFFLRRARPGRGRRWRSVHPVHQPHRRPLRSGGEQRVREPREDRGHVAVHVDRAGLHASAETLPQVWPSPAGQLESAPLSTGSTQNCTSMSKPWSARRGSGRAAARPAACSSSARRRRGSRSPASCCRGAGSSAASRPSRRRRR